MKTEQTLIEQLESLVDSNSVARVLECLSDVCHLKAQHIEENWQDEALAKLWTKAGVKINQLQDRIHRDYGI